MANLKKEVINGVIEKPRLFSILVKKDDYEDFMDYIENLNPPFQFRFVNGNVRSARTWETESYAVYMQCYRGNKLFTSDSSNRSFRIINTKLPIFWSNKCLSFVRDIESS